MVSELSSIERFIRNIPKAELHLHIEGTLEPEMMFKIAERNDVKLRYRTVDEVGRAYVFRNLSEFLRIYYEGVSVLLYEEDFYDLTWAYLEKAHEQNVVHAEIFFDPQAHTRRGIPFDTVIRGIHKASANVAAIWATRRMAAQLYRSKPPSA
ncbi:MAG: hypothetical protein QXO67_02255, partial [Candidatus Bathyarchaeia archaeon]